MDEINDFFDLTKDFVRETAPRGCISGSLTAAVPLSDKPLRPIKREYQYKRDFAREAIEENTRQMLEFELDAKSEHGSSRYGGGGGASSSCMDELDQLTDDDEEDVKPKTNKIDDGVYSKYHFDLRRDQDLPIHDTKDEIVSLIRKNPVIVLEGDTGCGKTTQVPQYILDDAYRRGEYCKIVCTQPRRIAAISIAQRVCDERKWEEGSVVGYKVGLHENQSEDTRLLYCTTGVLLQKLIKEKTLQSFTHIILDEVHERDQEMDFLLIVIRQFLVSKSRNVKIILMSATINTTEFADYFRIRNQPAPVLRVDSRRQFKVSEFFFNDLHRINTKNFEIDYQDPGISKELYHIALKLVIVIDNIEKQEASVNPELQNKTTSILIFLPGINEIDAMGQKLLQLEETKESSDVKLMPIRLHSQIPPDEQRKVFHRPPPGYRKVILATNIAESSITVPDVKYVIDFCLTKSLLTDTSSNFTSLQLHWASRANCRQRAGRAGRVMHGRVYRLVDKRFYDTYFEEFSIPEMLRCPLENVILKAKLLDMGSPPKILALAMSPPNLGDIFNTILLLKEVGALFPCVGEEYLHEDGDLTYLGRVMATMPVAIRLTRLIMLGHIYSCLEDAIIIAAGLSVRSIFKFNCDRRGNEADAHIQKLTWADGSGSDLFAILNAYRLWTTMRQNRHLEEGEVEYSWANRHYINLRCIKEMHLLVIELKQRLFSHGIKEQTSNQRVFWNDREKPLLLKIIIAGAFYPNYFTRTNLNDYERERSVYHTLCCNDPCNTVYFTSFNPRYTGQLYTRSIKELFRDVRIPGKNIDVHFQPGSQRVFITFKDDPDEDVDENKRLLVPGRVRAEVYKAVRMRMLRMRTTIRVMDAQAGIKYALDNDIGELVEGVWQPKKVNVKNPELVVLPSIFQKTIRGYITHIENCSKFYFQPLSEMERLREIHELLNSPDAVRKGRFKNPSDVAKGMVLAAPFKNVYNRARVLKGITSSRQHLQFKVLFIDYGNTDIVDFDQLRCFSYHAQSINEIPARVFECRLAMVLPSSVKSPNGKWSDEAMEVMQQIADSGKLEIDVYSVVAGVANVIMKTAEGTFNEFLVEKGHARKSDESFLSKTDHDFRARKQSANRFLDEDHSKQNEEYLRSIEREVDEDVEPPPKEVCVKSVTMSGPFSPLETSYFAAVHAGTWKSCQVERESVNAVLLDSDPQDVHERLMVATDVTETQRGDTLTMRSTTLMPNIHGFAPLMTLLFAPTVQIKTNKSCTKYTAILAGLGHDKETMAALYGDHDIVLNLDVDLLKDDLELINQLRYCMDSILYTNPDEERPSLQSIDRADLAAKIKDLLIRLLGKDRKFIEIHLDNNDRLWQTLPENEVFHTKNFYGSRAIFPLHSPPKLYDEKFDRMHALAVHCGELYRMRQYDFSVEPIKCLLCNQSLENSVSLRIHLLSQLHRDREQQIRFKKPH